MVKPARCFKENEKCGSWALKQAQLKCSCVSLTHQTSQLSVRVWGSLEFSHLKSFTSWSSSCRLGVTFHSLWREWLTPWYTLTLKVKLQAPEFIDMVTWCTTASLATSQISKWMMHLLHTTFYYSYNGLFYNRRDDSRDSIRWSYGKTGMYVSAHNKSFDDRCHPNLLCTYKMCTISFQCDMTHDAPISASLLTLNPSR